MLWNRRAALAVPRLANSAVRTASSEASASSADAKANASESDGESDGDALTDSGRAELQFDARIRLSDEEKKQAVYSVPQSRIRNFSIIAHVE